MSGKVASTANEESVHATLESTDSYINPKAFLFIKITLVLLIVSTQKNNLKKLALLAMGIGAVQLDTTVCSIHTETVVFEPTVY